MAKYKLAIFHRTGRWVVELLGHRPLCHCEYVLIGPVVLKIGLGRLPSFRDRFVLESHPRVGVA
jgi:hypothetical protein